MLSSLSHYSFTFLKLLHRKIQRLPGKADNDLLDQRFLGRQHFSAGFLFNSP